LDIDDQIAALRHNHDGLEKTVVALQRSTTASVNDLTQGIDRVSRDAHIAHSIAAKVRSDHRQLAETVKVQTVTLKQHRASLDYQAQCVGDLMERFKTLQKETQGVYMLEPLMAELRMRVDQINAKENATYGVYQALAQKVALLETQMRQPRVPAPIRVPRVEKPQSGSFFLRLSYGVVGVAFVAALLYSILPH
jgi:hypothetical protein